MPTFYRVISGFLKTLNNEDENILEDAAAKGLHKNVWKQLLDKVEALNTTMDTNSLNQLIKSVRLTNTHTDFIHIFYSTFDLYLI